MKDLIQKSREVEARLRKVGLPIDADTIAALCAALEAEAVKVEEAQDQSFRASEAHVATMARAVKAEAALEAAQADAARLEVQRDDARFALRKLREQIQGDCV